MRLRFSRGEVLPALAIGAPLVAVALAADPVDPTLLAEVPLALLTGVALLWRRRLPLVTLTLVLAATVVRVVWFGGAPGAGDGLYYLAVLVAVYSVGENARGRDGLVAAALLFAWVTAAELDKVRAGEWGELVGPFLSMAIAYGMGRIVASRTGQAADAEQRATRAERDRDERARTAVAEERARIARELHDIVAHHVSVMVIQAQAGSASSVPARTTPARR